MIMGTTGKIMVIGASGLVGATAVNTFLDQGWDVVAVSRRRPEVNSTREFQHLSLDLQDASTCSAAMKSMSDVTHVVYAAVYEMPGLMPGWSDPVQMTTNITMMENIMNPLCAAARDLNHVNVLQGTRHTALTCMKFQFPHEKMHHVITMPTFIGYRRTTSGQVRKSTALHLLFGVLNSSWGRTTVW